MHYVKKIKNHLFNSIHEVERNLLQYVNDTKRDFVRKRKLSFGTMIKILISMGAANTRSELLEYFNYDLNTATNSAFCQQRSKIKPDALIAVFRNFLDTIPMTKSYDGYRLIACDGSCTCTTLVSEDIKYKPQGSAREPQARYLHLNTLYDLCNKKYIDFIVEPERIHNEKNALIQMSYRNSQYAKTIYIADRGYESYNVMAHIHDQSQYYLIRIKDHHTGGFAQMYPHPDTEEYDVSYTRIFTRKRAKKYAEHPEIYTYVAHQYHNDFFTQEHEMYEMSFRILRIKITEDTYECIVTNLPTVDFDTDAIKHLYGMRWGIETSFKELKYNINLNYFYSKKEEFILQEIYARLILYNFCQAIVCQTILDKKNKKYEYKINFLMAVKICRNYLKKKKTPPCDIEKLLMENICPIRPGRSSPRKKYPKVPIGFHYRA